MNIIKIFLIVSILFNLSISIELCIDVIHPTHVPIRDWWGILIDSLESWGANIHLPDTSYEWGPDYISCCDKIWIIGEGCHAYEELQKISLIGHVKSGKPLSVYATTTFLFPGCTVNTIADLLEYDKWNTTVKILYQPPTPQYYVTKDFLNYPLLPLFFLKVSLKLLLLLKRLNFPVPFCIFPNHLKTFLFFLLHILL